MNIGALWRSIPPVTKNLILINILIWLLQILIPGFDRWIVNHLGLHPVDASDFNPVQILTYMFLHDNHDIFSIFFNMFTLWLFGRILEDVWGSRRFFVFYMVCGIGTALVRECYWLLTFNHYYISAIAELNGKSYEEMKIIVDAALSAGEPNFLNGIAASKNAMLTIGASGAIFGLLLGFAMVAPNMPLYFFFVPVPVKAKYMVLGYALIEFFIGMNDGDMVNRLSLLGGVLFALPILLYWKHKGTLRGNSFY